MKRLKRVYVYEDSYNLVVAFAKELYEKNGDRGANGKPIHKNFPASLQKYLVELNCKCYGRPMG